MKWYIHFWNSWILDEGGKCHFYYLCHFDICNEIILHNVALDSLQQRKNAHKSKLNNNKKCSLKCRPMKYYGFSSSKIIIMMLNINRIRFGSESRVFGKESPRSEKLINFHSMFARIIMNEFRWTLDTPQYSIVEILCFVAFAFSLFKIIHPRHNFRIRFESHTHSFCVFVCVVFFFVLILRYLFFASFYMQLDEACYCRFSTWSHDGYCEFTQMNNRKKPLGQSGMQKVSEPTTHIFADERLFSWMFA